MAITRSPAVAGMFYPNEPNELRSMIEQFLNQANSDYPIPKAIIAPHAGYIYSGSVAGSAYACLKQARDIIRRVVLLGPSHRHFFHGLAISSADYFETPLGKIKLDKEAIASIASIPQVHELDVAHVSEHSLEVQLPFLQIVLKDFTLVPIVVGDATQVEVADVLEQLWNGQETLIVVSSDLSHYLEYDKAKNIDQQTIEAILNFDLQGIGFDQACGRTPILGLLSIAEKKGLKPMLIDLKNSGDTAGPKDQVVGYAAVHFR